MFKIKLKENYYEFKEKLSVSDILKSIDNELYKSACCCKINGKIQDLRQSVKDDCVLEVCTFDSIPGKHAYWHTTSHILAQALLRLYKNVKLGIGPAIDSGFYYDFELDHKIAPEELPKIEKEMKTIIKENIPVYREFLSTEDSKKIMQDMNQIYKLELIEEHSKNGEIISVYKQNDFLDICVGPHLLFTGQVVAVKLTNITGAYWRGNSQNKMLQRIYGISFPKKSQLNNHLELLEKIKLRDHRKLGKQLKLFYFSPEGPGFPFFLTKGTIIKNTLIYYWRKIHNEHNYKEISSPIILSRSLWETSGHWHYYKNNMYTTTIDSNEFAIKPMNCPGAILAYKSEQHSYRDLPLRICELGLVHRHELSGTLHGLMRARCFTQDDAHIFLQTSQITSEIKSIINIIKQTYSKFNFKFNLELSTMPEKHIGSISDWDNAIKSLKVGISESNLPYTINEGDGAFYGPKIDFIIKDCLGRNWQCGTIQLDFQLPERFNLEYIGQNNNKCRPVIIHRVIFGSIERFIGILIEHFSGKFPFWLAPIQIMIIPISKNFLSYARRLKKTLSDHGFRTQLDDRNEKMGYKFRESQIQKIPFTLIVGENEQKNNTISLREHGEKTNSVKTIDELIHDLKLLQDINSN